MTEKMAQILDHVTRTFKDVRGIDALVLGGSHATGTASATSDIDIGVYYDAPHFDLALFQQKAAQLDDAHRADAITPLGAWGPWINGGGWLKVAGMDLDILFRDSQKTVSVIDQCLAGHISIDYQCGHPFGFVNSIYMGELVYAQKLYSGSPRIAEQKKRLQPFPPSYQQAAIKKFLWECDFSLLCGRKAVSKKDSLYAAGSLFRCALCLVQVLYAINEMYMLNEKGSLARLLQQGKIYIPKDFPQDITRALEQIKPEQLDENFERIDRQYQAIQGYVG